MDALTRLLDLADVRGVLDLRCRLAGGFSLDPVDAGPGEAPFHLVLAGRAVMERSGQPALPMEAGDLFVLPRGTRHRVHDPARQAPVAVETDRDGALPIGCNTKGVAELDLLCGRFTFAPDAGALLFGALPEVLRVRLAHNPAANGPGGIVELFRGEIARMDPGAPAIVTALTQALLVVALRAAWREERVPPSLLALVNDPRLGQAILAMLREPAREWTVAALAEQAAMSRATFARHFEARGKLAPREALTLLRMHLAAGLLRRGELTAGAVADRVGYRSESAFGKAFSRAMGVTPARFRRDSRRSLRWPAQSL